MNERELLGARIAELRKEAGLSQAELAERVGTRQNAIARLEKGAFNPGFETLQKIAEVFGYSINFKKNRIMNDSIYKAIAVLAEHLFNSGETMKFSQLADRLSGFFGVTFCDGRAMASRVKGAYFHYEGNEDIQRYIAEAFVNEGGEYAYE